MLSICPTVTRSRRAPAACHSTRRSPQRWRVPRRPAAPAHAGGARAGLLRQPIRRVYVAAQLPDSTLLRAQCHGAGHARRLRDHATVTPAGCTARRWCWRRTSTSTCMPISDVPAVRHTAGCATTWSISGERNLIASRHHRGPRPAGDARSSAPPGTSVEFGRGSASSRASTRCCGCRTSRTTSSSPASSDSAGSAGSPPCARWHRWPRAARSHHGESALLLGWHDAGLPDAGATARGLGERLPGSPGSTSATRTSATAPSTTARRMALLTRATRARPGAPARASHRPLRRRCVHEGQRLRSPAQPRVPARGRRQASRGRAHPLHPYVAVDARLSRRSARESALLLISNDDSAPDRVASRRYCSSVTTTRRPSRPSPARNCRAGEEAASTG